MKKLIPKTIVSFIVVSLVMTSFFVTITGLSACRKDTTCTAVITVIDTGLKPVPGATVKLHAPKGNVQDIKVTDGSGKTTHTFKLRAIFDVDVTKGNMTGTTIIKLEPGETVSKTVNIQ